MDEEKTIDEAVEEQADEMKEFEPVAFDEVIKEEPAKETAPVLRALGDPDPADMNMIHKHLDNFLAKIAGETPIDENVRDSTEYWLNRIAEAGGGGGTTVIANPELAGTEDPLTGLQVGETKYKGITPLYLHILTWPDGQYTAGIVINNSPDALNTASRFAKFLYDSGCRQHENAYPLATGVYSASSDHFTLNMGAYSTDGSSVRGYGRRVTYTNGAFSVGSPEPTYIGFDPAMDLVIRLI